MHPDRVGCHSVLPTQSNRMREEHEGENAGDSQTTTDTATCRPDQNRHLEQPEEHDVHPDDLSRDQVVSRTEK